MKTKFTARVTRLRLLLFCVSVLALASVTLIASAQVAKQGNDVLSKQTAPVEQTVEQRPNNNIQVLTGLPTSQLNAVMNYMGSSLGVKCIFCHEKNGDKWDFPSDKKPEKTSAREMIKMVQGINKANFKGNPAVSCFTCHRGSEHPARVPQLPIAMPTPFEDKPATGATKETPPTADQILAKYTAALGGSAVIDKLKTRSMKGTLETANGMTLGYEVYQAAPDKLYMVLNTPKQGVIERGFSGTTAWERTSRGGRSIQGAELFYLRRYPDLFKDTRLQGQFSRISYRGKDQINGKDVNVLVGMGVDGKGERLFFDAQTGLLVRRITSTTTMVGVIPEQVDYEDYREVDGMKQPFTIRVTSIDSFWSSTRKFTEIKLNVPVDETKFNEPLPPPEPKPTPKT
jgi:hypothetical protein